MVESGSSSQNKLVAAALGRLERLKLRDCFDPVDPDSRPTSAQRQVFEDLGKISHRYCVAANQSGKSATGAREVAWLFAENHPKWTRPKEWGNQPLLMIVVGRVSQQVETELWENKIKRYLTPGSFKEVRTGAMLQKVINKDNGNTILFASHHATNEAREKLQAYVAHYVWLDEMPKDVALLEELHRRIQAKKGYFLATFTPKVRNDKIRKMVESSRPPFSKKYQFKMFDNPIYTEDRQEEILHSLSTLTVSQRNTILNGDWTTGESAVYQFDSDRHVEAPINYHKGWRHVEVVDPALKSKLGLTVWAQCPSTNVWYCVRSDYVSGIYIPTELITKVTTLTADYNIVRRVSDPHEVWYMQQASSMGFVYMGVYKKNNRKHELIKNLQQALGDKIKIAPWCEELIDEFVTCQWSEAGDQYKIVNASSYHLLDTAQYFVDCRPRDIEMPKTQSWQAQLRMGNEQRKKEARLNKKAQELEKTTGRKTWRISKGRSRW